MHGEGVPPGLTAVADQLLAFLAAHERALHSGDACMPGRVRALAYLAHAVGMPDDRWCDLRNDKVEFDGAAGDVYAPPEESGEDDLPF